MPVLWRPRLWPGIWNTKFAGFLCFLKRIIFRKLNRQSEENFSHNNRLDQFITDRHHSYPAAVVKEYGPVEKGNCQTQN